MAEPTRYQDVISATNYALTAEDGTPFPLALVFNGSTQFLQTNPTDFTSTDKVLVAAGVRKLSAGGMLVELGSAPPSGTFYVINHPTLATWQLSSSGTSGVYLNAPYDYPAPITNILTGIGDISGDRATLRINGAQVAQSTADQGTGNYGDYPLYIGARAGTSLFFNGRLYSLIIAGIKPTDAQILGVETYINSLTRAF